MRKSEIMNLKEYSFNSLKIDSDLKLVHSILRYARIKIALFFRIKLISNTSRTCILYLFNLLQNIKLISYRKHLQFFSKAPKIALCPVTFRALFTSVWFLINCVRPRVRIDFGPLWECSQMNFASIHI